VAAWRYKVNLKAWGGLSLRREGPALNAADFTGLRFSLYGVKGNTRIKVFVYSDDTTVAASAVIAATTGSWKDVTLPWSKPVNVKQVKRIASHNDSPQEDTEILVDNLALTGSGFGACLRTIRRPRTLAVVPTTIGIPNGSTTATGQNQETLASAKGNT
jgi:hypothetical protein